MEDAIKSGDTEKLEHLLEEGADPNGHTEEKIPYLFLTEKIEILTVLLEYGADITTEDENGFTVMDYHESMDAIQTKLVIKRPKFLRYRCSVKQTQKKNTTRRVKRSPISS